MTDTPANSAHFHRPVRTMADRVAQAMAEGDVPMRPWPSHRERVEAANSGAIADKLGISSVYVRSTQRRIRQVLGPQAK